MNESINFLRNRQTGQVLREKKRVSILRRISIVFLLLVSFFSLLVFFLTTRSSLPTLRKEESALLSNLSPFQTKAGKLLFVESQIKDISGIVEKKSSFDKTIDTVTQAVPQNVLVKSFSIDKKNVVMTVSSSSLLAIDTMFNRLADAVGKKNVFSKITLDSFAIDTKSAYYIVSLSLDIL